MKCRNGINLRRIVSAVLVLLALFIPSHAFAADFESWDTVVTLAEDGTGLIETTWVSTEEDGTEKYIVIDNLPPEMELFDFEVSDERGAYEREEGDWNVDRSRAEKAMRYGIHQNGTAKELCWGYGEYGKHTYKIRYKIKNLVFHLQDADALNFMFLNRDMSEYPAHASLEIHGPKPFREDDVRMWAFGFDGTIHRTEEGFIRVEANEGIPWNGHLTVLLSFPKGYFNSTMTLDERFEDVLTRSLEGSSYDSDIALGNDDEWEEDDSSDLFAFIPFLVIFVGVLGRRKCKKKPKNKYRGEYYHEVPYEGPFYDIAYFLDDMGASDREFLSAFFLKWVMEERIRTTEAAKKTLFGKEQKAFEILKIDSDEMSKVEKKIWKMFAKAAGEDQKLDPKEFNRYVRSNASTYRQNMDALVANSEVLMKRENYLTTKSGFLGISKTKMTETGEMLEGNLYRFKNYLKDYSLLSERESMNVHIWDQFMIYAATFGILEEVYKEFSKLYPEYREVTHLSPDVIFYSNYYSTQIAHAAARQAQMDSFARASSGGGGFSSFGGGGGSFGGGSGGGSR